MEELCLFRDLREWGDMEGSMFWGVIDREINL